MVGSIEVKSVGIAEIDTTHVKVSVNLTLVPERSATLADIQLCAIRLNGLPAFAEPVEQEVPLRKGVLTSLPPIYLTVLFRDLTTVEPLRQMIEKQNVHVQGELVAGVQLDFAQKLALHTQHPSVAFPIAQDVAVQSTISDFQRSVALGALKMIESGLGAKDTATQYIPGAEPAWVHDVNVRTRPNLYWVDSTYSLAEGDKVFPIAASEIGFALQSGKLVAPSDVMEPWKYDAEFMGALKSGTAKLVKSETRIELRPANAAGAPMVNSNDFTVAVEGTPAQDEVTPISFGLSQVKVLRRAAPSLLAVITPRSPMASAGLAVAPDSVLAQDKWDHVALFRMRVDSATGERRIETLELGASKDGAGIHLSEPVDSAVFGSPIVTPEGVIGQVQDQQSGTFLPKMLLDPTPLSKPAVQ